MKMSSRLVSDYLWNRYESDAALYVHIVYISQGSFIDNDYNHAGRSVRLDKGVLCTCRDVVDNIVWCIVYVLEL